ncbi:DUF6263 family protein [Mucilaginibacter psychrotolerans]|uniref:Uncharacterized protein n=1 Tax=Mucilaginibacter psychrotolerans TaxID=1524096 RepID=A0A4Y8SQK6_9SPHI|nr:DUF6263 family protein [Mucilaginibacter psychrotolerans]TFF40714.1 hypothetical protein E2R66_00605 [Mucilaginibacter psychrotolerans]
MKKSLTLLMLFISINSYAQTARLELNLKKDSTYNITINADMDIDQLINGLHQIVKTTISGTTAHKVIAIKDTLYEMEVIYKKLGMHMEFGGKVIEFSSDLKSEDLISKFVRSMINKPFGIVMSRRGKIVEVKNIDSLFAGVIKDFPPISDAQVAQVIAQMKQSFGEKSIKGNLQETFVIFPKVPLAVKGNWTTVNATEAAAISLTTKTTYTLNAIADKYYDVSGTAVITSDKVPAFKKSGVYLIRLMQPSGRYTARMKIDKTTGWVTESQITKDISATAQIKKTEAGPIELSYPMKILMKFTGAN